MTRIKRSRWAAVAFVAFAAPFFAVACDDEPDVTEAGGELAEDSTTIYDEEYGYYEEAEFNELDSAASLGRTVTISANVHRIIEPGKAFITGNDAADTQVLVIIPPKAKDLPSLADGDDVLVVGKVIKFVSTDVEAMYEPFDLDDNLYSPYDDAHAIVAQTIIKPPAAMSSGAGSGSTTSTTPAGTPAG